MFASLSPQVLALFAACAAVATVSQKLTGFAFTLLLVGFGGVLGLAPVADLANAGTVLSLASAWSALSQGRRGVDFRIWRNTAWGSLGGVVIGLLLLGWLQANLLAVLKLILGITVVACAVSLLVQTKRRPRESSGSSFVAYGLLSGVLGGLFAASGPPLVYHLYRQALPVEIMRNTLVATLAAISLARLALVVSTSGFSVT
ncbi:MAG TPA: TSUP family transporter, partial [Ramlibacter sp.]|nr:TSUP family transporter [Ramlibacter sp.]